MKLEIKSQNDNHLLNRTEVQFELEHSGTATPSRLDVIALVATKTNRDKKFIVIKQINTIYGKNISKGLAYIYTDEKAMKIEPAYIIKSGRKKKVVKKEEAPVEEKKEVEESGKEKEGSKEGQEAEKTEQVNKEE